MPFATATHLVRGSASLLLAILLIALRNDAARAASYRSAKLCLICTALINVMLDCLSAAAEFGGYGFTHTIDRIAVPVAYTMQIALMSIALAVLIRSGKGNNTMHFMFFHAAFVALSIACAITCGRGHVLLLLRTVTLAGSIITFLNRKAQRSQDIREEPSPATAMSQPLQESGVLSALLGWQGREDKPYLKEGLTIADVAKQVGTGTTQISFVLNHSLGTNFNTWINRLRIAEAKRLLENDPGAQITDIAYRSGFSDVAVFSRNFKKIEGLTATEFKKKKASEAAGETI